jgi:NAD-dependent DNA ligase
MSPEEKELQVMAHRYLYYVMCSPVLSDSIYDVIEREARAICPPESPVHGIGSSLASGYTGSQVEYAHALLRRG